MKYLFNDIFNNKGKIETLVTFISCRYLKDIIDMSNDIGNTPILSSLIDNNIDRQQYRSSYRREEYAEARTHPLPLKAQFTRLYILANHRLFTRFKRLLLLCLRSFSLLYIRSFLYIPFVLFSRHSLEDV